MERRIFITQGRGGTVKEFRPKRRVKKIEEKFCFEGYILKSYDATYERTMFEVFEHDDVLEVEDLNSGMRFIVFRKEKK